MHGVAAIEELVATPEHYGAIGDGVADDSSQIRQGPRRAAASVPWCS